MARSMKSSKGGLHGVGEDGNPPSTNLWVGNLSQDATDSDLMDLFGNFGALDSVTTYSSRSFAFVYFKRVEDASTAKEALQGHPLRGSPLKIEYARPQSSSGGKREGQPSNILWIGYPPSLQIDEQMLHNAMILFGEIERIKSFPSRHYSFVEFRSVDEARRAKESLQGRLFNDPRITIMYSSSELGPGKEVSNFYPGVKGAQRTELLNEPLYGSSQVELYDRHVGLSAAGRLPSELNELASAQVEATWRRPSSTGILPSPASRIKQAVRPGSSGWDVIEGSQIIRDSKRARIDPAYVTEEDTFSPRNYDHGFGPNMDLVSGLTSINRKSSLSPVGIRGTLGGSNQGHIDNDFLWRGTIAKGGTPVCHARCVPIGNGIESELPEVVNCSARTGLDMLAKHYAEATGFDIVFFLPDSEEDFASYTEFLRYLGSKSRAGVAKFDDGTTLFLVPPSEFLTKVLNVKGPERLYGVVLKLPQPAPVTATMHLPLHQPIPHPQYVERHQIPPPEDAYNLLPSKEDNVFPIGYGNVLHEDPKPLVKSFYQSSSEPVMVSSALQEYPPKNTAVTSQAGVSLTPELIATLTSILPMTTQSSASESGPGTAYTSTAPDKGPPYQGWKHDSQFPGAPILQSGNQIASSHQIPTYPPLPSHAGHLVHKLPQIQDSHTSIPHLNGIAPRPLANFSASLQTAQYAAPQPVSQHYQVEGAHSAQKGPTGAHGTDVNTPYNSTVAPQLHGAALFPNQFQVSNYAQAHSAIAMPADKVSVDATNQTQPFQNVSTGAPQATSEAEVDKNQRYQSTLQFAASLLLGLQQQQQQQQANMPASQGS